MDGKIRRSAPRVLALVLAFALCLTLLGAAPGTASSGNDGTWTKVTSAEQFTTGQYYMVTNTGYAPGVIDASGSNRWISAVPEADAPEQAIWTLTVDGSTVTLKDSNNRFVAPKGGETNGIIEAEYSWTWAFANGMFTFSGQGDDIVGLASNKGSQNKFRAYKLTTIEGQSYPWEFTLYKLEGGSSTPTVAAPSATPQASSVTSGTQITLSTTTEGATIYYTLNGDDPTTSSTEYTGPITIEGEAGTTVTLKAVAVLDNVSSAVQTISYTIRAESEPPIANGDKVVIYNPEYKKALSSEKVNPTSFYNKGVDVELINGVLTGYTTTEVWTVVDNKDGTFSFQYGEQNIGLADQYNSMNLGAVNDRWKLIDLGNGLYNIQNAGRGNYMEWYNSENNWSTYNSNSAATDGQFQLAFYKVTGDIPDPSEPEVPIKAGDKVGIYLPSEQLVITTTANSYGEHLVGATATLENNELTTEADNAEFTVSGNNTEGFTFVSADGKYLTTSDSGNTLTMADASSDYSLWILESNGSGGWFIKNKNAAYNDNAQYIEYFNSNFTTYSKYSNSDTAIYSFQFYPIAGEGSEDGMPIKADDTVGIYLPDSSIVITATASGNRLSGASATLDEGTLTTEATDAVFTVGGNSTEGFTFESADGKYLTTSATGNTLSMEDSAGEYSRWILEQNGEDGWFIKSMNAAYNGNAQYIEYYGSSFTTYRKYSDSDTDIYTFQFYPVTVSEDEPGEELPSGLVVLASPVSGATVGAGDTITLTTMEGAMIYYTIGADSTPTTSSAVYSTALTVGSGQVPAPTSGEPLVIKAIAYLPADGTVEDSVDQTSSVYTFTYRAPDTLDGYNLYFGQLHSHTNISDGAGSVTDAFEHAAGVENLDFLAVTDHSNSFDNEDDPRVDLGTDLTGVSSEWKQGHEAADEITAESNGTFVGIYGFEMTWSGGFGHINTFNTPGFESRKSDEFPNNPTGHINYYNKLVEVEKSLSQFNHPGTTFGDFADFGYYSQAYDERINLIEVGNGEGAIGSSGYFPSYEYYTRALDKGWHVAPTNNQDNHKGNWGDSNTARSVVLASELTEDAIYDAIANHRVYATEDNDLSILYSLNDNVMGSIIGEQDAIEIEAQISDPTDSADMTVEVIVNGGLVIGSKTLSGGKGTVTFNFDSNDYSYYYLRVTQADKNIAVTAPVWTGESINAGISKTECDTVLVVKDETVNISSELFNNSNLDMQVTSLVYTVDGETIYEANIADIGNSGVISTGGTAIVTFPHAFTAGGATSVEATMIATIGDTAYTFTSVLQLTVTDESLVTRVLVDGTHWNDYVNGYYAGNMGNFTEIAAGMNAQVTIQQPGDPMTADDLNGVALLVISAPLKYTSEYTGDAVISTFEESFIQLVSNYVNGGGTVIVCGLADYQDANSPGANNEYTTYTQINNLLSGIGSTMRVNDDELLDQDENGGQPYRLYFDDFNYGSTDEAVQAALAGLENSGKVYSSYSGCSVDVGNGTAIVYGHDTTYSINSKAPTQGHGKPVQSYSDPYNAANAVVPMGDVVSLATEKVGAGRVYLGGTVWLSDFEVTSDGSGNNGDDYGDASYANKTIITNILSGLLTDPEVSTIAEARAGADGDLFTVEGTVIAGSVEPNAFFDCIYIQDATGAICLHPVGSSQGTFEVGQKVRATGYRGDYQGDVQLGQVISAEVIDENIAPIPPREFSLAEAVNYGENGGYLAKVSGTVKSVESVSGQISSVILTDGTNDFRLLFNNYIGYSDESSLDITTFVEEGAEISAVGVIYMDPAGVCLRVRDLSEVELVTEDVPDVPIIPGRPVTPSRPSDDDEPNDEPSEPFIDVTERDWFFDAIVYVYNEGMMSGVESNVFNPNGNMTRAMFWTVLARIDEFDTDGGATWYSKAQEWAVAEGVSDGTNPDGLITREQLATMLYRYAGEPEANGTLDGFSDAGSVSAWAYDALVWAVENGIVTGMGDGILAPQGNATRAQAATMFMRYMSVIV